MSKRNKPWWKESKKTEVLELIDHIRLKAKDKVYRRDAQAFYDYFVRNGYFTPYMKIRTRELAKFACPELLEHKKPERKTDPKLGEHYLYAISDGEFIKIGYSKKPKTRLKQLQTARAKPLKLLWQVLCSYSDVDAKKQERKLHRRLKSHKVMGEWYEFDCLIICRSWRVRGVAKMKAEYLLWADSDEIEKELDMQMLEQIQQPLL